jgi:TonB-dependent SusC/RagA subfamily outer membrane receptor
MNELLLYILKSAIWIAIFYGIYRFFFLNETFLKFNRIFLFIGMIAPFVLALCQFRYPVEIISSPIPYELGSAPAIIGGDAIPVSLDRICLFVYIVGALGLFSYYGLGLSKIRKLIGRQDSNSGRKPKVIYVSGIRSSFSFFGYVFMDSQAGLWDIEKELILAHETAHVGQRHWVDILLAQFVCVLQWFNPFAWLYLSAIKQNHEFLADRSVIDKGYSPAVYQAVLINSTFKVPVFAFTNSFAYYYKFKRITIMKKSVSKPVKKWAVLLLLPAFAAFLAAFAKPEYHYSALPLPAQPEVKNLVSQDTIKKTVTVKSAETTAKPNFTPPRIETVRATKVTGQVLDTDGKPIAGASIVQKGGKQGTVTDMNGNFTLITEVDSELRVVYIDKEEAIVKLTGMTKGKPVSITLKDEADKPAKNVDSVVNTLTATYATCDDGDDTSKMKIRGDKSNPPLFILDGKEITSIDHMNPDDIANISVFKDSSATSVYGEKGKNGVVIITSKRKGVDSIVKHTGVVTYDKNETRISINGIGDKNPPLYILDGKEITSLDHLHPEDIDSISVLKNNSATSVYGEKGKNGVIIITSKKKE